MTYSYVWSSSLSTTTAYGGCGLGLSFGRDDAGRGFDLVFGGATAAAPSDDSFCSTFSLMTVSLSRADGAGVNRKITDLENHAPTAEPWALARAAFPILRISSPRPPNSICL